MHPLLQRLRHVVERTQPAHEENSRQNSRTNISRHYDLSNELFEQFLDETMTYSSAWFEPGDALADAQRRKMDGVLDLARVGPDMHVLEIGSGWGALAIRAARERGARVTTLTLSTEQQALARQRAEEAGVGHLVDVRLQDYRDATGQYDAIVSVEMIEAVGEALLADLLRGAGPPARPGRPGRAAGDHDGARPDAGHPAQLHLDPQVRVPRRDHPVDPVDLGQPGRAHRAVDRRAPRPGPALRPAPWRSGGSSSSATGSGWRAPSTTPSGGCGSSTSPTARPASASATSGVSQLGLARAPVRRRPDVEIGGARIWVTGASSGIGAALARELADRGASVAISARNADKLREVAGGRMHVEPVDVTDRAATVAAGAAVRDGARRPRRRGAQRRHLVAVPARAVGQRRRSPTSCRPT